MTPAQEAADYLRAWAQRRQEACPTSPLAERMLAVLAEREADREVVLTAQAYYANWCQDEADHPEITGCEPLQHEQAVALRDAFERRAAQHTAEALKAEGEDG